MSSTHELLKLLRIYFFTNTTQIQETTQKTSHSFDTPQSYLRKQYFEALDLLINELKRSFQQKRGLPVVAAIEKTLLDAANGSLEQVSDDLQIYKNDLDLVILQTQLHMFPDLIRSRNTKTTLMSLLQG